MQYEENHVMVTAAEWRRINSIFSAQRERIEYLETELKNAPSWAAVDRLSDENGALRRHVGALIAEYEDRIVPLVAGMPEAKRQAYLHGNPIIEAARARLERLRQSDSPPPVVSTRVGS